MTTFRVRHNLDYNISVRHLSSLCVYPTAMLTPSRALPPLLLTALLTLAACSNAADTPAAGDARADSLVQQAVARHGGDVLDRAAVTFTFRDDRFRIRRNDGMYRYVRSYEDSLGRAVEEVLTNDSLYRAVDGARVDLTESERLRVEEDVNSVTYFALLPYFLQAPAAHPEYAGADTIDGTPYHRVRVTFQQEGGGRDWDDTFVYWFDRDDLSMDYLAYAYGNSPDETYGTRFREAYNVRTVEGVRFADYVNYTAPGDSLRNLTRYPRLLARDSLERVSRIELDDVAVRPLDTAAS